MNLFKQNDTSISEGENATTKPAKTWLKEAIRSGNVSGPWENGFPRYVWTRKANSVFIARLTNQGLGHYKGWPVTDPKQWPKGI